jgi:hypothetical protein
MRLYPRGAPRTVIDDPVWGHFEADEHGGFDLPDEMSDEQHSFHHRGKPAWENDDERSVRLHGEDLDRRRDPAALYDAVGDVTALFRQIGSALSASAATPSEAAETELAALRQRIAELEGSAADDPASETAADGEAATAASEAAGEEAADPKPASRRSKTAAAKTAE